MPPAIKARELIHRQRPVKPLWTPYADGPQERAYHSEAKITGYGGAAGGGKTDLILGMACTQHRKTLVIRRESPQFEAMIQRSQELFEGKGTFNGSRGIWKNLPGGRRIEMSTLR